MGRFQKVRSFVIRVKRYTSKKETNGKVYEYENRYLMPVLYVPKATGEKYDEFQVDRYEDDEGRLIYVIYPPDVDVKISVEVKGDVH